jgi:hypothetical protein
LLFPLKARPSLLVIILNFVRLLRAIFLSKQIAQPKTKMIDPLMQISASAMQTPA